MDVIVVFMVLICVYLLYMLVRCWHVYDYRVNAIYDRDPNRYKNLPSYDYMLFRFWVYPLSRFERKTKRKEK